MKPRAAIDATVTNLLRSLEAARVRYAILRNYETFPSLQLPDRSPHTDIDLVLDSIHLAQFREILVNIAETQGWDLLIECDHWAQSATRAHNIEVFRFVRLDPLEHLQVDVFHGILIWGLPFFNERQMLEGRIYDYERGLTRIDPVKENLHRILQIHGLYPAAAHKRKRYREKILAFRASSQHAFDRQVQAYWPGWGPRIIAALDRDDTPSFRRYVHLVRARFAVQSILSHPFAAARTLWNRLRENIQRYFTRQCGAVIPTAVRDQAQRQLVREVMDDLVRKSFMDVWREREENQRLSLRDYKEMEQGTIIIRWTQSRPSLDLRPLYSRVDVLHAILNAAMQQHEQLFHQARATHSPSLAEAARR